MSPTKNDIKGLLAGIEERLQTAIATEIKATEKRLDKRIEGVEKRLEKKIDSQGKTLQIFFDQQLRKTNGLIEDIAQQLKINHEAVTHVLEKQADLEEHVEKLEERVLPPL